MAASVLPEPGEVVRGVEIGPCKGACEHTDCALTRRMAAASCAICGKPIGYDVRFYAANKEDNLKFFGGEISPYGTVIEGKQYEHAVCLEEKIEFERFTNPALGKPYKEADNGQG